MGIRPSVGEGVGAQPPGVPDSAHLHFHQVPGDAGPAAGAPHFENVTGAMSADGSKAEQSSAISG